MFEIMTAAQARANAKEVIAIRKEQENMMYEKAFNQVFDYVCSASTMLFILIVLAEIFLVNLNLWISMLAIIALFLVPIFLML